MNRVRCGIASLLCCAFPAWSAEPAPPEKNLSFRHDVPISFAPPLQELAPAAGPHLVYYGGPVVSTVKIYQVLWGTGTFVAGVADGGHSTPTKLGDFYTAVSASSYIDWLCEYNAPTQSIGRGTFLQTITITPDPSRNGSSITDTQIQAELVAQFNAGKLPHPDGNTSYMIDFPAGKTIFDGTSASCVAFCAYHGTGIYNGQYFFYTVLPDFTAGSGCDLGCGPNAVMFDNVTSAASHELIETITDPAVGQAPNGPPGPPMAWYDLIFGEIGDYCNQLDAQLLGADGVTYIVQDGWSNQMSACIAQKTDHPPVAQCQNASPSVFGCTSPASIDNGSFDPDCWDTTLTKTQNPPGPYPVGATTVTLTVTDHAGASSSCSATVTVTSTGCDDGIACTTGDTCTGAVCSGTPGPPPAEVGPSLMVAKSAGATTITWVLASGATGSDVLRGLASALPVGPGGGDEVCLGDNIAATTVSDSAAPPARDAYWYLVRGKSFCGIGPYGYEVPPSGPPIPEVSTTCP